MDPLSSCYNTDRLQEVFGSLWCGPDKFEHGEETLIAELKESRTNDGYGVRVYATAMPATFFTIQALNSRNSIKEFKKGFMIETGSGMGEWALETAKLINEGMVSIEC